MMSNKRKRTISSANYRVYQEIKHQLLDIFETQKFDKNKLPPEAELAQQLGISLVTLREALLMLALEGYVTKRHGSGNYLHPSAMDYKNRSYYFADCLGADGYKVTTKTLSREKVPADEDVAQALSIAVGEEVLLTRMVNYADDRPAIISTIRVPAALLLNDDVEGMDFGQVHILIWEYLHRDLAHALNEYYAGGVTPEQSELFGLAVGTPIMECRQLFYDAQDVPVLYSHHAFYPNLYRLNTLQNWDLST